MTEPEAMAYIGREPCGHVTCITVDALDHKAQTGREIAKWVRWGLTVERVTVEQARQQFAGLSHKQCNSGGGTTHG